MSKPSDHKTQYLTYCKTLVFFCKSFRNYLILFSLKGTVSSYTAINLSNVQDLRESKYSKYQKALIKPHCYFFQILIVNIIQKALEFLNGIRQSSLKKFEVIKMNVIGFRSPPTLFPDFERIYVLTVVWNLERHLCKFEGLINKSVCSHLFESLHACLLLNLKFDKTHQKITP